MWLSKTFHSIGGKLQNVVTIQVMESIMYLIDVEDSNFQVKTKVLTYRKQRIKRKVKKAKRRKKSRFPWRH